MPIAKERDGVDATGSDYRCPGDAGWVDVPARQIAAGDRRAEVAAPDEPSTARERIDGVVLGGDIDAAAGNERLRIDLAVDTTSKAPPEAGMGRSTRRDPGARR
jgi:hypothetical protein